MRSHARRVVIALCLLFVTLFGLASPAQAVTRNGSWEIYWYAGTGDASQCVESRSSVSNDPQYVGSDYRRVYFWTETLLLEKAFCSQFDPSPADYAGAHLLWIKEGAGVCGATSFWKNTQAGQALASDGIVLAPGGGCGNGQYYSYGEHRGYRFSANRYDESNSPTIYRS